MARTPVYSTQFFAVEVGGSPQTYEIPDGFRAVVREVYWFLSGAETSSNLYCSAGDPDLPWYYVDSPAGPYTGRETLRQVFDPGDTLRLANGGAGIWYVRVSGYLLGLP